VKKIKEIKEDEETSLFEEIKFKSQAAMEYLMTYGWAILIIALSLVVLYSLGIMNPKNFIPRAPPGSCFVFRPNGPGTTDFVSLQGTCGYLPMYVASFNGVNGYINISSVNPTTAITVGAWVKSATPSGYSGVWQLVSKYNAYILGTGSRGGQNICFIIYNGTNWYDYSNCYTVTTPQNWHYFVGTFNSSTHQEKLYVDGVLVNTKTVSGTINPDTGPIHIAHREGVSVGTDHFNGSIANVQIYSTALTPQEIQYLYQQGLGGGPVRLQNLVGWWPLNGDAKDYSGNNNHGTINGGVTFVQNYNPP
jgi:hypothetical protein